MPKVCIGIGTNKGLRAYNIKMVVEKLSTLLRRIKISGVYETEPYGFIEQPNFMNLVVCGETTIPPLELLNYLKRFEREIGRSPEKRWGPREIDLDILLYGEMRLNTPSLSIPHPDMCNRPFVIIPLIEVEPGLLKALFPNKTVDWEKFRESVKKIGRF